MALMICNKLWISKRQKNPNKTYFAFLRHRQALDFFGLSSNHTDSTKQDTICSQNYKCFRLGGEGGDAGENDPKASIDDGF